MLKVSLWLLLNMYRHWISGEKSPRCPAAEQRGVAQTRAPALHWNTETVREYPVRLAQAEFGTPKWRLWAFSFLRFSSKTRYLHTFRAFVFERWCWTITSPFFLQRRAWWLFLNLPACPVCACIHHCIFLFLLPCQSGRWNLFSAVDRAWEKAGKVQAYMSRPAPAKCASMTKQSMQIPWPLVFYHHLS